MDIVSLPLPFDENKVDSRFRLVILATERARKLMSGAKPAISTGYIKPTTVALEELAECDIKYITGKEARQALQESMETRMLEEMGIKEEELEEELKDEKKIEIEKELGVYVPEPAEGEVTEETEEE